MSLFGTNGVRGRLDVLTPQLAFNLAASFCSWGKMRKVAIGRDMRLTGPMIFSAAEAGIMAAGAYALELGIVSSPVAEFFAAREKADGLIIVTASHNPPEWNALKVVDCNGVAVSRERGAAIEKLALEGKWKAAPWDKAGRSVICNGAAEAHAAAVLKNVDAKKMRRRKLRLVLDFGSGTSSLSRSVFEKLGCEVIAINGELDGTFPGRPSEPSEQHVQGMLSAVRKCSADLGVAWDGDSDRVIFADERGEWIVGDKGFAVSALAACRQSARQKEKFVVTTVATSRAVEEACAETGGKTIYTKVGTPYLSERMLELSGRAVSGGEEVGGIIWPAFSLAKDGIYAAAKMAEMCCEREMSELVSELPPYYNSKCRIEAPSEKAADAGLDAARKHAEGMGGKLMLLDGVRADVEDGWAIVRASGTENAMRVFAEGKSQKKADSLMNELADVVRRAIED